MNTSLQMSTMASGGCQKAPLPNLEAIRTSHIEAVKLQAKLADKAIHTVFTTLRFGPNEAARAPESIPPELLR